MSEKKASREDIAAMARIAGLDLAPQYFEELVEAYRGIEPMLANVRRSRERADEPAHTYDPRKFMPKE